MNTDDIRCRIMEEELGTFWPQWHVVKRLGGGAFGDVFEIYRDNHGVRTCSALKVLRVNNMEAAYAIPSKNAGPNNDGGSRNNSDDGDIPEVFMNEIRIMEALRGAPNIVLIEDFYFQEGADTSSLYVRMELLTSFVDVMSAHQRDGTQFTIPEVLKIGKDICTALSFCEQKGIIHRDIKPANLFVDNYGNYKVGDFGVSKRMETVHPTHMLTGIGTISYMAPEIFAGRSYNNTVDIYALGLVLYQLLNNCRMPFLPADGPYVEQELDAANYRRLHGEELPPLVGLRVCGDTISARLDSVIRRACDPDSHRRYRTAKEFYDALSGQEAAPDNTEDISKTVRTSEGGPREPYPRNARVNGPGASSEKAHLQKPPVIQQAGGPERQNRKPVFVCAAILLAAVFIFIGVKLNSGHKEPIQTASTESEAGTETDNEESPVFGASNQSASSENEAGAEADKDESPVTETSDQSDTMENEDNTDTDTDESPASEESDQAVSTENEDSMVLDKDDEPVLMAPVQSFSSGWIHSAVIDTNGSLWLWGENADGQLGDGSTEDRHEPVKIMDDVQFVSLGVAHTAAIKTDGSLWSWGDNTWMQLGDGTYEDRHEPVKIMDDVQSVSLGAFHSAAIKTDGSLWLWGRNNKGQLGDGSINDRHEPVKVMDDVQSVALSGEYSAAIKTDGSLWLWGFNDEGQLGDGSTEQRYVPVKIMDGVQSVALGDQTSAALKTDGSLWLWGRNNKGQLGDGSINDRHEPVKIMDGVQSVSLGAWHSAALKTDGSLWLWGFNEEGQLGDGSTEYRYEPVKIMDGVQTVSLGLYLSAAIKADGSLWLWGRNTHGELGDGSTEDRYEPICIVK